MGKPDAPTPPDPRQTAAASTSTNVGTAIANSILGNVNQYTPTGSLEFETQGNYSWTDPYTGSTYTIPRFTATQTLSDEQQAIQDQLFSAQLNMAGLGNMQSGMLAQHLADPFDISGAPSSQVGVTVHNTRWVSIGETGFSHAPICQVTMGQRARPEVELISIAATFNRMAANV